MTKKPLLTAMALIYLLAGCIQPAASPTPESTPTTPPTAAIMPTQTPQDPVSAMDALLNDLVDERQFCGAVLVAREGDVLLSKGYGLADRETELPNTPQTRFRLASITKQFTAMAILMLESQGKLDVQDPICDYVPDCPTDWQPITIHHLLTHTSGIPNFTAHPFFDRRKATPSPPEKTIALFRDDSLSFQPGERYNYSNSGYIVLGYIIEQTAGQSYEAFLQENIFDPLGMQDSGYDHNRDDLAVGYAHLAREADYVDMSIYFSAGALYSTVEDLYRWDQALYTERLVSSEYLTRMFTEQVVTSERLLSEDEASYGYGWFILDHLGHKLIGHHGGIEGFSTGIWRYPDDKVAIIVLSNQQNVRVGKITESLAREVFAEE